jgi:hypothetical protein
MPLEQEIETYRRELRALLAHKGKYVVIQGDSVIGIRDTFEEALSLGYETCGLGIFLVRQISETEKVLYTSRSIRPCPS